MISIRQTLALFPVLLFSFHCTVALQPSSFSTVVIEAEYRKEYELVINTTTEYLFLYRTNNVSTNYLSKYNFLHISFYFLTYEFSVIQVTWMQTARIEVESNATHDLPLIVVVHQKRGILSWQIPLVVNSMYFQDQPYNKTSRTLCSAKYYRSELEEQDFVTVSLFTASNTNISFKLNVTEDSHFYLKYAFHRISILKLYEVTVKDERS